MKRAPSLGRIVGLALVGAAAISALFVDPRPARPASYRAGYRVLEADLHTHTSWSDGALTPANLVVQAERRGLDVIAVTEHNTVVPSLIARAFSEALGGPIVVTGEEVTTARSHIVAIGIEKTVVPDGNPESAIAAIHAQGGLAIAAHPVARYWDTLVPVRSSLDGAEVMHPLAYSQRLAGWRWADMLRFYDDGGKLAAIGSSDYHSMSTLGLCRTLVFVQEPANAGAVIDAVRAKRTVVFDRDGVAHGDPALIEALAREPYAVRTSDYTYRGENTFDRVTRIAGLLGLVLVVFGRGSRRRTRAASSSVPPG